MLSSKLKIVLQLVLLLFIGSGLVVGVRLVRERQEIREKAAGEAGVLSSNYHHHLHTFSSNYDNAAHPTSGENYALEHRYAMEMGFSMISRGKPEEERYNDLGIMKPHNALQFPLRFKNLNTGNNDDIKFFYRDFYNKDFDTSVGKYKSAFDENRHVLINYDIDSDIIEFIKIYACAQPGADLSYENFNENNFSIDKLYELFYPSWTKVDEDGLVSDTNLFMNWHSEFVANDIATKTLESIDYVKAAGNPVDGIFFDQVGGYKGQCGNADHDPNDNYGVFPNGGEGQKYFLKTVNDQVKTMQNRIGLPYFVTVNIGQPKSRSGLNQAKWYADPDESKRIRFDHYYSETGVVRNLDTGEIITDLKANGTDPETGKPAYVHTNNAGDVIGYLPAERVSVDTEGGWYTFPGITQRDLVGRPHREDDYWDDENCLPPPNIIEYDDYSTQHLRNVGTAGSQGSWFGWYKGWFAHEDFYICDNGLSRLKTNAEKEIVYTDERKLMQVIPNWDNLLDIPLSDRQWDEPNLVYQSPNSYSSPDVIYSRHFETGELFVVFTDPDGDGVSVGEVTLKEGEEVKSAYFVNEYFEKTMEDARSCLDINDNKVKLKAECDHKLKTGIRISSTQEPYTNGLVSSWNFNETEGDAIDSVSGFNGKLINGVGREEGVSGNALKLDGVDDFVFIGDVLDMHTSDMSVSFWVKTTSDNHVALVSKAFSVPYYNIVKPFNGKVRMDLHNGVDTTFTKLPSNTLINDGEWHHVAAVYDRDDKARIYVDGSEENSVDISADAKVIISNPSALAFGTNCKFAAVVDGKCKDNFSSQLNGSLDEVGIYNKALSADEVRVLYTKHVPYEEPPKIYYHHINNFGVNNHNPKNPETYAFQHRHALEMGYSIVQQPDLRENPYPEVGVMKNLNAAASFMDLRFEGDVKEFSHIRFYLGEYDPVEEKYKSAFGPDKHAGKWYSIDQNLIDDLKGYACAKENANLSQLTVTSISASLIRELFHTAWVTEREGVTKIQLRSNWQSKAVVEEMAQKSIETVNNVEIDGVFFDQFAGGSTCGNADYGGKGSYNKSFEGEKEFLATVVDDLRQRSNSKGYPYFFTANFGSPYLLAGRRAAKLYQDGSLRFDFYYSESGNLRDINTKEFTDTLDANGVDPETGKPAFVHKDSSGNIIGFIPADKVDVDTEGGWYQGWGVPIREVIGRPNREDDYRDENNCYPLPVEDDYFTQHLRAVGIGGNQGSWFGYYGGDTLHGKDVYICENGKPRLKTERERELVYTNDRQLLRAIPNWDNLLDIPLSDRQWNEPELIYESTNSYASPDVIYSRHFETGELFAAFTGTDESGNPIGELTLKPGESVTSAYFVNEYFEKTMEDAMSCLNINGDTVKLKAECKHKLKTGIRVSSTIPPYTNGLVSHWSFNETEGDAIDTVSGNNGKLVNGASRAEGVAGSALELDGIDDYVFVGDVLDMHTSDMSVSFWVKTTSNTYAAAISKAFSVPYYNIVKPFNGKVRMDLHNGVDTTFTKLPSNTLINDGEWHHVAAVYDRADKAHIYVDGAHENSVDISGDEKVVISNPSALAFGTNCKFAAVVDGKCKDDLRSHLQGSLDEIGIYNKALTAEEVSEIYSEFAPTPTPTPTTVIKPDLAATALSISPSNPEAGEFLSAASLIVDNTGTLDVDQSLQFRVSIKDTTSDIYTCHRTDDFYVNLSPGASNTYDFTSGLSTCPVFEAGKSYRVAVEVDSSGLLDESNEDNNTKDVSFNVAVPTPTPTPTSTPVPTATDTPIPTEIPTPTVTIVPTPTETLTPTPTDGCQPGTVPGDANGDCEVDGFDYVAWWQNFGNDVGGGVSEGDFDEDGDVDGFDYAIWWQNFGT